MAATSEDDKVAYRAQPKVKATLQLDKAVPNSLFDAIRTKYEPPIAEGSFLLCSLKSVEYISNSYLLYGKYVTLSDNKTVMIDSKQWLNDQPKVWVIEILSNIKDIYAEIDMSNIIFNQLTKPLTLSKPELLLEYEVGDHVLLRPKPTKYNNGTNPKIGASHNNRNNNA